MPRRKPPAPTERAEQRAVVHWLTLIGARFAHVPNYGRHLRSKAGGFDHRAMAALKQDGVQPGHPDLLIYSAPKRGWTERAMAECRASAGTWSGPRGVAIELKSKTGKKPTDEQLGWIAGLQACGWVATWKRGSEATIAYLVLLGFGAR